MKTRERLERARKTEDPRAVSRRKILREGVLCGSVLLSGFDKLQIPDLSPQTTSSPFAGGKRLGIVPFSDEPKPPMGQAIGAELDGRLFTDLSDLMPENPVTPTNKFYIRTRASKLLDITEPWTIRLGRLEKPVAVALPTFENLARPMGVHLMECVGNTRSAHFGMLSVADWDGVLLQEVFESVRLVPSVGRVLISGFDQYATESRTSLPGASWIFTPDELISSRAFLATKMNGQPLTADHGAPIRLIVPGWYGCACIKWVNEILLVAEDAPATSQMQEYAGRTMQEGVPELAKEYRPARIEMAAMPIRVEKWSAGGKIKFRVVGIQWGGSRPVDGLEIRFNVDEKYMPVDDFRSSGADSWNFWSHSWLPAKPGKYLITLHISGTDRVARRLESGYYARSVEIGEI
jgi:DMSO/TMAO reductase YedYZ molybdopterin-dependent catalytic subunit